MSSSLTSQDTTKGVYEARPNDVLPCFGMFPRFILSFLVLGSSFPFAHSYRSTSLVLSSNLILPTRRSSNERRALHFPLPRSRFTLFTSPNPFQATPSFPRPDIDRHAPLYPRIEPLPIPHQFHRRDWVRQSVQNPLPSSTTRRFSLVT